ncbi:MAG: hypothetical protein C5B59_02510 [Bacteroidetes bacterium]|nr:MAG: hypothetical protein C5B59_02510 [Bacteroidota bacterium]
MKKKKTKKRKRQIKPMAAPAKTPDHLLRQRKLIRSLASIIAVFAFLLYVQSINHQYTLDDHRVIDENTVTKTGIAGIPTILKTDYWYGSGRDELRGPIYRPIPLIIFAIVWEFFPNNPNIYHFINIFLHAVSGVILLLLFIKLLKRQNLVFPFVCALLFVTHPIHTEVVNNIKSLDEILCLLFGILSIGFFIEYSSSQSIKALVLGGASFFLTLLSKETGIAFLLIIPLTIFFFSDQFKKRIVSVAILLGAITGLWLIIRMIVFRDLPENVVTKTSELNNTLYATPDLVSRYATAFYILIRYIGLLIFPHPLTADYNFAQIKIQRLNDPGALLGIIFYFAMGIYSLVNFRKKRIVEFGTLFFLLSLAPVSNMFFLGGSSMAERFMYIPSLGFCIVLAYFLIKLTKTKNIKWQGNNLATFFSAHATLFLILLSVTILYSIKTFSRSKDWKDTLTIYSRDIQVSKNSATANELLGNSLVLQVAKSPNKQDRSDTFNLAKKYLKRALEIAPGFFDASSNLGYVYLVENKPDSAYQYLHEGSKNGVNDIQLNYYYGSALFLLRKYDSAIKVLNRVIQLNKKYEDAYLMLASSYLGKGDINGGLSCYSKLIAIYPNNPKAYYFAGGILRSQGDTLKAKEYMNKALSLGYNSR